MDNNEKIHNLTQARKDYVEATIAWLQDFPTDRLLEEYNALDAMFTHGAIIESVLLDTADEILDAIRTECVVRLGILMQEKGAQ